MATFVTRFLGFAVTATVLSVGSVASAQTFSISGGTYDPGPYDIESASPNFNPPWGIQQTPPFNPPNPPEDIYRSLATSTGTMLVLSAPANVTFQYIGKGDADFVNEFKVFDAVGAPLLAWCTQGSSVVACPEAKINPGFESGPTKPFVASTTVELHNLQAGPLNFAFIGNVSTEGVPGPVSGAIFNTTASNICGLDTAPVGTPPHPGDVCFGIAVPHGAGTNGLNSVKVGFKDGGQSVPYDPDFQDMAIKVTISSVTPIPTTSPQGLLALALLLAVVAIWRFRSRPR